MKLLVVSDIHGSGYYARKLDEIIKKENPDKIILLGDLYYHGPRNDLTQEYAPLEVARILNFYKSKILAVRGNCDAQVDEMISEFSLQENLEMEINGLKIFFTHGHKYNKDHLPNKKIDAIIYGHFHTAFIKEKDEILCINSGSISLPKNGTENSYLIIDGTNIIIKDVNENIIEQKKIEKRIK